MNVSDKAEKLRKGAQLFREVRFLFAPQHFVSENIQDFVAGSLSELADLLEAQEKAEPVGVIKTAVSGSSGTKYTVEFSKNGLPSNTKLYTHPPKAQTGTDHQFPFEAACSGLRYESPEACGEVSAIHISGKRWALSGLCKEKQTQIDVKQVAEKIRPGIDIHPSENWKIVESSEVVTVSIPHDLRPGQQLRFDVKAGGKFVFNMMDPVVDVHQEKSAIAYLQATTKALGLNNGDDGLFYTTRILTYWIDHARAQLSQSKGECSAVVPDCLSTPKAGDTYAPNECGDNDNWIAGIDVEGHSHAIECFGLTLETAEQRRNFVLALIKGEK